MGHTHQDPTDHFRTTHPRAGITMKDNFFWPGFILLAVAFSGIVSAVVAAAYRHNEWLPTTVLIAFLAAIAAALWFLVEVRRLSVIDEHWKSPDRVEGAADGASVAD